MIGYLEGPLLARLKDSVLLLTSAGVGYQVSLPTPLLDAAGEPGERAAYFIVHVARKDEPDALFGFADLTARNLFELLISVSGIGPKAALAFLSAFTPPELSTAIVAEDVALLSTIPGIGKKTAARLCVELSDRLSRDGAAPPGAPGARGELLSALTNLGFQEKDVLATLQNLRSDGQSFSEQLKQALALLGRN
ncbi:MAG: Holliday junction branch migration protein RuvA [bacterium]